jgi:hypothetical protein
LVTLAQDATDQFAICLNAKTGKRVWKTRLSRRYENGQGNGPRSTPTIVDGAVYVYTGDGIVARLDLVSGKVDWKVDAPKSLHGNIAEYGLSCSPLVADGKVVFGMDPLTAKQASSGTKQVYAPLVCLSTTDGKLVWRSKRLDFRENSGYASPSLMSLSGKPHVAALTGQSFKLVELETGRIRLVHEFETDYACNTASPLVIDDDHVFISAGENHGAQLLKISSDGNDLKVAEVWSSLGKRSVMRNEWQTSIRDGDYLYGFDNQGGAGPITNFCCLKWKTGEVAWKVPRFGKANMIMADGKLWMSNIDGEMIVADVNPKRYNELGRTEIVAIRKYGVSRQTPVLANGRLYFRGDKIVCVDVRNSPFE